MKIQIVIRQEKNQLYRPGFLTSPAIAILIILTQDMFRAFLMGYFLMQCETP